MSNIISPPPAFDEIRAPLVRARRLLIFRYAARIAALSGVAILLVEILIGFIVWKHDPRQLQDISRWLPLGAGLTVLVAILAAVLALRRHRDLAGIAGRAETTFPELGLRLNTSLEAPEMTYCTPAIRGALWRDTRAHLARVAWKKFLGLSATLFWTSILLCILLVQAALTFPAIAAVLLPSSVKKLIEPVKPHVIFRASLEIVRPGEDQWATKIEAIPLQVRGDSPDGLNELKIMASVNGQPPKEFALNPNQLAAGKKETEGSLYLDELEVQDYDVVSYSVVAKATRPGETAVDILSPIFFIQIRPFRKDVMVVDMQDARLAKLFNDLLQQLGALIEEQRMIIRGTWLLDSESRLPTQEKTYEEAGKRVADAQEQLAQRTKSTYEYFGSELQDAVSADTLVQLDKAREQMELAVEKLRPKVWTGAIPHEQQALAELVQMLRDIQEIIAKNAKGGEPSAEMQGLKDRQSYREPSDLEKLAEEQEKLNQKMDEAKAGEKSQTPEQQKAKMEELAKQQQQLSQETQKKAQEEGRSQNVQDTLEQAGKAMDQSAEAMTSGSIDRSSAAGRRALDLAKQAAAQQEAEERAKQAAELKKMMGQMSSFQSEMQKEAPAGAARQKEMAEGMSGMKEKMEHMAERTGGEGQNKLKDAAEKTGNAGQQLEQGKGDDKTLQPPIEALAKAYEQAVGRPAYMKESEEALRQMKQEMEGLAHKLTKEGQGGNGQAEAEKTAREWLESLHDRSEGLQQDLRHLLGSTAGMSRFDEIAHKSSKIQGSGPVAEELQEWIAAIEKVHAELLSQMQAMSQRDVLRAMQNDGAPAEYREMVNEYFERLSREFDKEEKPAPPAEKAP